VFVGAYDRHAILTSRDDSARAGQIGYGPTTNKYNVFTKPSFPSDIENSPALSVALGNDHSLLVVSLYRGRGVYGGGL